MQLFSESLESLETQLSQETAAKQGQRLLQVDIPTFCFFFLCSHDILCVCADAFVCVSGQSVLTFYEQCGRWVTYKTSLRMR